MLFVVVFLIFLFLQQLNQHCKICMEDSSGGKHWSHHENLTFVAKTNQQTNTKSLLSTNTSRSVFVLGVGGGALRGASMDSCDLNRKTPFLLKV